ncbi:hypothetical protein GJR88_05220 [Dietzia sp. DQ12-45-1b]|nr:hypothetical protein GJR88_05220 [Dietzia sp. DQ12-45-1b]
MEAKYVCAPYQKIATMPRTKAGNFAPRTPMDSRAITA